MSDKKNEVVEVIETEATETKTLERGTCEVAQHLGVPATGLLYFEQVTPQGVSATFPYFQQPTAMETLMAQIKKWGVYMVSTGQQDESRLVRSIYLAVRAKQAARAIFDVQNPKRQAKAIGGAIVAAMTDEASTQDASAVLATRATAEELDRALATIQAARDQIQAA